MTKKQSNGNINIATYLNLNGIYGRFIGEFLKISFLIMVSQLKDCKLYQKEV